MLVVVGLQSSRGELISFFKLSGYFNDNQNQSKIVKQLMIKANAMRIKNPKIFTIASLMICCSVCFKYFNVELIKEIKKYLFLVVFNLINWWLIKAVIQSLKIKVQ